MDAYWETIFEASRSENEGINPFSEGIDHFQMLLRPIVGPNYCCDGKPRISWLSLIARTNFP